MKISRRVVLFVVSVFQPEYDGRGGVGGVELMSSESFMIDAPYKLNCVSRRRQLNRAPPPSQDVINLKKNGSRKATACSH